MQRAWVLALLGIVLNVPLNGQQGQLRGAPLPAPNRPLGCCLFPPFPVLPGHGGHNPLFIPFYPYGLYEPLPQSVPAIRQFPSAPSVPEVRTSASPARALVQPKIIELPEPKPPQQSRQNLPAVFVFANGRQIEAQRYLLTADILFITLDRRQFSFPLTTLDLNATIQRNRQRGINLHIPGNRNEILLSF